MMKSVGVVPNVRSYTALVGVWGVAAGTGLGGDAIGLALAELNKMKAAGVKPDVVVYNRILVRSARALLADVSGARC